MLDTTVGTDHLVTGPVSSQLIPLFQEFIQAILNIRYFCLFGAIKLVFVSAFRTSNSLERMAAPKARAVFERLNLCEPVSATNSQATSLK